MPEVLLMHPEYNVFSGDTLIIKYSENYTVTSQKVYHGYCIKIEKMYAFFLPVRLTILIRALTHCNTCVLLKYILLYLNLKKKVIW